MTEFSIDEILPHARPMVLLDAIDESNSASIRTHVLIRANAPFMREDGMPSHIAIEYMAQSCAAFIGLQAVAVGEQPQIGFLLGTRNFLAQKAFFSKGETLSITATVVYKDAEIGVFDCLVVSGDDIVANASLTVFQPQRLGEFGADLE